MRYAYESQGTIQVVWVEKWVPIASKPYIVLAIYESAAILMDARRSFPLVAISFKFSRRRRRCAGGRRASLLVIRVVVGGVLGDAEQASMANMIIGMHTRCGCNRSSEVQVWGRCKRLRL